MSARPAFRIILALLLTLAACNYRRDPEQQYFRAVAANDLSLPQPQPGDWRHDRHEKQQSLADYQRAAAASHTDSGQMLALLPIGTFTPLQMTLLEDVRRYCAIFFQREVVLIPPIPDSVIPPHARRFRDDGHEQLQASYIIDSLLPNLRQDGTFGLMAITANDLYPQPDWNFVFGLANYNLKVGVSSIYRLQDNALQQSNYKNCLLRLNKIGSHEVAHMLKLHHCLNAQCVMNGTNSLRETDLHPARACSLCQQKLHENLGFGNRKRLQDLERYFTAHGLTAEAGMCRKDLGLAGESLDSGASLAVGNGRRIACRETARKGARSFQDDRIGKQHAGS